MDRMNKEIHLGKMDKERNPARCRRIIKKGDRIFARLTMGARTIAEFMIDKVESMTDLLLEVHREAYGVRGLCKLYVRNQSRGWAQERPLMLYGPSGSAATPSYSPSYTSGYASEPRIPSYGRYDHMPFPWETH